MVVDTESQRAVGRAEYLAALHWWEWQNLAEEMGESTKEFEGGPRLMSSDQRGKLTHFLSCASNIIKHRQGAHS